MKRNNMFMLAYIAFIFIAVWTKPIYDSSIWNRIVGAVTVTSWLFALADTCALGASLCQEIVNEHKNPIDDMLLSVRDMKNSSTKLSNHILTDYYGELEKDSLDNILSRSEESCIRIKKTIRKCEISSNCFRMSGNVLLFFGFLAYFCVVTFEWFFNFFANRLDGLTLLSFGTILASQCIGSALIEHIKNCGKEIKTIKENWNMLKHHIEMEALEHAD